MTSRRGFLERFVQLTFGALGAVVVYPVLRFLSPPHVAEDRSARVLAAKVADLSRDGWKIFPFGSEPGILVEVAPGEYRAFSATCTHLECTVQMEKASHRIWCACHNGYYDLEGRNVAGPPPRPLTRFTVHVEGEDIYVSRA
ncbi:MAG TPA: Rieske (2Fe-2S) protein [Candidatus Eisenbacteria bacterium]|nr:Rieske (2Fe-2S) protein [Candidatus Eisenbacteria bacterium]